MSDSDLSKLHGDELTWALHRENRSRWREAKARQRILLAIILVMLAAQLGNFHVGIDPTLHLPHLSGV